MKSATTVFAGLLTVGNLFAQKPAPKPYLVDWQVQVPVERSEPSRPSVVCGMTMVRADPKVDPKMRDTSPATGTTYAMRVVPPTVCATPQR